MVSPWKERIPNWDEPSSDVDSLCERFLKKEYIRGDIILPYRIFLPEKMEDGMPLVLFLHGADVTGRDNDIHLRAHDIGSVLARDKWQSLQPSVIIAPQYDIGYRWGTPATIDALYCLITDTIKCYPGIATDKILVYGYSAGGIGALQMIKAIPELFCRAIIICGSTSSSMLYRLTSTPMWLFHAVDDGIVPNYNHIDSDDHYFLGSAGIYDELREAMGDRIRYTEYAQGEMLRDYGVDPHCTWVPVAKDKAAWTWFLTGENWCIHHI